MRSLKASELVAMLNNHIKKYGDDKVMILDGYEVSYKTINSSHISRTLGDYFVIECENEEGG